MVTAMVILIPLVPVIRNGIPNLIRIAILAYLHIVIDHGPLDLTVKSLTCGIISDDLDFQWRIQSKACSEQSPNMTTCMHAKLQPKTIMFRTRTDFGFRTNVTIRTMFTHDTRAL